MTELAPESGDGGLESRLAQAATELATNEDDWDLAALGQDLAKRRRAVQVCARHISESGILQSGALLTRISDHVAEQTCKIAIVGQVKCGKSSFVNVFSDMPGLLPTNINPWTTAVTRMHFGSKADDDVAARFTFFDADEWHRIAYDGGTIRELTRRFVPGFEPELLADHLEMMRATAEARLGDQLPDLLGTTHGYDALENETLEQYVCAGPPVGEPVADETRGRFADIVKSADLYFPEAEVPFPLTFIDTPGTNDPFLVRDEVTRRALDDADVFILLLTARQALATPDLALMRILHGLNKRQLVVFINRIDELSDPAKESEAIERQVSELLRREFPNDTIPIVVGSVRWAERAKGMSAASGLASIDSTISKYASRRYEDRFSISAVDEGKHDPPVTAGDVLRVCSGLPELVKQLRGLIRQSRPAHVMTQAAVSLRELAEFNRLTIEQQRGALRDNVDEREEVLSRSQDALRDLEEEVSVNDELMVIVQTLLMDLSARSDQMIDNESRLIRDALMDEIDRFAAHTVESLGEAFQSRRHQAFRVDTQLLRQHLAIAFDGRFVTATENIGEIERTIIPKLIDLIVERMPGLDAEAFSFERDELVHAPRLTPLSHPVSLDLPEPWWRRWWSFGSSYESRARHLGELIRADFAPIAEELGAVAYRHLHDRQDRILQKTTAIFTALVDHLRDRAEANRAEKSRLAEEVERWQSGEAERSKADELKDLEKRLAALEAVSVMLAGVTGEAPGRATETG